MSNKAIYKDFKDFVLFLYLYMADADGRIDNSEVEVILEKMKKIYPEEPIHNHLFEKALEEFQSIDKSTLDDIVKENLNHYSEESFTRKFKIFADLYDIINADGVVDERESKSMDKLREMIDQSMQTG